MGHGSSRNLPKESPGKGSRDIRLLVPDDLNNMHTVVVPYTLLIERSQVFKEMAINGKIKKKKKLKLLDVTVAGVLKVMQYVEDGTVAFETVTDVSESLKVAEKYGIEGVKDVGLEYLSTALNSTNALEILEFAVSNSFTDLIYKCLFTIDQEAELVLKSSGFTKLKPSSVQEIIKRNNLNISSENCIFNAVLRWGEAEVERQGGNLDDKFKLKTVLQPILNHVRFQNMSSEELSTVTELLASLQIGCNNSRKSGMDSKLNQAFAERMTEVQNNVNAVAQPRVYKEYFIHTLAVFESSQHSIVNGEVFLLSLEMLKGKAFVCGVNLAMKIFSSRMNASCLYASLSATNTTTTEQKRARGTFLDTAADSTMLFSSPLYIAENNKVEFALSVKMAGNVCPMTRQNDIEIIVTDDKEMAMKVLGDNSTNQNLRCIFKDIIYYF